MEEQVEHLQNVCMVVEHLFGQVIQDFAYLDLKPISIEANLTNALSSKTFV